MGYVVLKDVVVSIGSPEIRVDKSWPDGPATSRPVDHEIDLQLSVSYGYDLKEVLGLIVTQLGMCGVECNNSMLKDLVKS
jgi:hypothetical protein